MPEKNVASLLDMTYAEQNVLAEICQVVSTPAYRLRCGESFDEEQMHREIVNVLLAYDKVNWGTLYDKLHRSGKNR